MSEGPYTFRPKNGGTLVALIVARISGCAEQTPVSNDDQVDHAKHLVEDNYAGPVEYIVIETVDKGEAIDRPELDKIYKALETRRIDLLVVEDLSRLVRGGYAVELFGFAKDCGTRAIALNDGIDTDVEGWDQAALSASSENVRHNNTTSQRIKFKTMNRFEKWGSVAARPIMGYIVPDGAKTYGEWKKDEAIAPWIVEGFERLRTTRNCSATADWLNENNVPLGPFARRSTWDGPMVRRIFSNPILKGMPWRGRMHTVKVFSTGRRVSRRSPRGPKYFNAPHLAFVSPEVFDEVNALLTARNQNYRRKLVNGVDPLTGVPRRRSIFPAMTATCWYCGRHYVWGGNGVTGHLMCSGSRERRCWNSIGFSGELATKKIVENITTHVRGLDGFEQQFQGLVQASSSSVAEDRQSRQKQLDAREKELARQRENLANMMRELGPDPLVLDTREKLRLEELAHAADKRELAREIEAAKAPPPTPQRVRDLFEAEFLRLSKDSREFSDLLRRLVTAFHIFLVRSCDSQHLVPRAMIRLNLGAISSEIAAYPQLKSLLEFDLVFDLFSPPERIVLRDEAVRLNAQGLTLAQIASQIPGKPSDTAVGRALKLDALMRAQQLVTPYVPVYEPIADHGKLKRSRHPAYQFTPLSGYVPPPLPQP